MLKIGDFSRLSHVTAKALRYYDQIGLFKPAYVDSFTDYRYYSVEQLPRLNRILLLKDLGLSLDEIGRILDEEVTTEQLVGMLRLKRSEVQQQVSAERARLAHIEAWLDFIIKEKRMSDHAVTLKALEPMTVASRRTTVPHMKELGETVPDLFADIASHKKTHGDDVSFTGYPLTIYHDEELRETDIHVEAAMPVVGPMEVGRKVKVRQLAAVPEAASVVHKGDFSGLPQAYQALLRWVAANDYEVAGPGREVYLKHDRDGDPADYVTEIQIPVRKGAGR